MDTIIWLVLMVVFLIAEASTVAMVSLWFAAGSLVALIAALRQYVFIFFHNAFPAFYLSLQNKRFAFC